MEPSWDQLYEVSAAQQGLFTTRQAEEAGYSVPLLHHHVKAGRIQRLQRGIYRLVHFPAGDQEPLVAAWLWSDRAGVASHQSALALHSLSDILPSRIHLTVPESWRKRRLHASSEVVLHYADLVSDEVGWYSAVPTTSPKRTLVDCARASVSPELVRAAAMQAVRRGLVQRRDLDEVDAVLAPFGGLAR